MRVCISRYSKLRRIAPMSWMNKIHCEPKKITLKVFRYTVYKTARGEFKLAKQFRHYV